MRQGQAGKRSRGRNGRRMHNPRIQVYDSNGPSVRIRGNALQIFEKYQQLARDSSSVGDRVATESLQQYAEHYFRLHTAQAAAANDSRQQQQSASQPTAPNGAGDNASENASEQQKSNGQDGGTAPEPSRT